MAMFPVSPSLLGMPLASMWRHITLPSSTVSSAPHRLSRTSSTYLVNCEITNVRTSLCKASVIFGVHLPTLNWSTDFNREIPPTKFHENPSSGSQAVPLGRTKTGMAKANTDFSRFANACKNPTTRSVTIFNVHERHRHL
jgi:hypothetical protein